LIESFVEGRPRVTLRRTFSLVPSRDGRVTLPGLQWRWWDVRAGTARTASLPAQTWQVAPGDGSSAAVAPGVPAAAPGSAADKPLAAATGGANRRWVLAALLFAALWLFTLVWALQHRARALHFRPGRIQIAVRQRVHPWRKPRTEQPPPGLPGRPGGGSSGV